MRAQSICPETFPPALSHAKRQSRADCETREIGEEEKRCDQEQRAIVPWRQKEW